MAPLGLWHMRATCLLWTKPQARERDCRDASPQDSKSEQCWGRTGYISDRVQGPVSVQDPFFNNEEFQHGDSRALGQVWALPSYTQVAARAQAEAPGRPQQERGPPHPRPGRSRRPRDSAMDRQTDSLVRFIFL